MSGMFPPTFVVDSSLSKNVNKVCTWRRVKRVNFCPTAPNYVNLMYHYVYGGIDIYGQRQRFDGVVFLFDGVE